LFVPSIPSLLIVYFHHRTLDYFVDFRARGQRSEIQISIIRQARKTKRFG
jgi:hypothetical protein